jgi:hypothetical protein
MAFDKDVFISYAHLDNQPLTPEQQGWITRFHATLDALLSMRLGRKAAIWRDDKLGGSDIFGDEIVAQFGRTALLASVLTPRYLASEWCNKEMREFVRMAEQTGGAVLENKSRVFKVLKTPVESQESLPAPVQGTLGYEFYIYENGVPLELDPAYGDKYAQDYNRTLARLAWEAKELLKKLDGPGAPAPEAQSGLTPKATVYLAEVGYDRRPARECLEADLKLHGYAVLPDQELPRDEAAYIAEVQRLLARCTLSIHLVGSGGGAVPDGPGQKAAVILQNELGARRSKEAALQRVIWLPEGTQAEQPAQQAFIAALHTDADAQFGADLVTGDLEQLKSSIHAVLKKLEEARHELPPAQPGSQGARSVYLICDQRDRKAVLPLRKLLKEKGVEAAIPAFEGDAAAVREANQKLLTECDAVVLFYGAGDEAWKRTMDNDLKKMKAYRSGNPLLAAYTYLAEPMTPDKQELIDLEEPNLIDALGGFAEGRLASLLEVLGARDSR